MSDISSVLPHPAAQPVVVHASAVDLTTGWNGLMGLLPSGLTLVMAIVGIALIIWVLLRWWWKHRHGSQGGVMKGAPVIGILIGVLLAAPLVVMPVILTFLSGLIQIGSNILTAIGNML